MGFLLGNQRKIKGLLGEGVLCCGFCLVGFLFVVCFVFVCLGVVCLVLFVFIGMQGRGYVSVDSWLSIHFQVEPN